MDLEAMIKSARGGCASSRLDHGLRILRHPGSGRTSSRLVSKFLTPFGLMDRVDFGVMECFAAGIRHVLPGSSSLIVVSLS